MIFLIKALQLILSLSILIVVHEFGHFMFARLFGVRVAKFYLFFNPKFSIFRAKKIRGKWQMRFFARNLPDHTCQIIDENGVPQTDKKGKPLLRADDLSKLSDEDWRKYPETTEWGIGWVPFGGYCAISGMVDETTSVGQLADQPQEWEYRSRPAWQRFFIIIGGVLFNFIFAILVFAMLLFRNGEEVLPVGNAVMGYKYCQVALDNGFRNGDIIASVDGVPVYDAKDVVEKIIIEGKRDIVVLRGDGQDRIVLPKGFSEQFISANNKQFMSIVIPFVIDSVLPNSIALKAGLAKGDNLVGINDKRIDDAMEMMSELEANASRIVSVDFYRNNTPYKLEIPVGADGKLGVILKDPAKIFKTDKKYYNFFSSFPAGVKMGYETLVSYIKQFRLVFTKAGAKSIGGFGSIGSLFPDNFNWTIFWSMTALISVILAFMNILPIPVLDGGYILFIIYEIITGKKPSDRFMEISLNIGMAFVFALLIYANGNDIIKWALKMF